MQRFCSIHNNEHAQKYAGICPYHQEVFAQNIVERMFGCQIFCLQVATYHFLGRDLNQSCQLNVPVLIITSTIETG